MIRIHLPYPPSVNSAYANGGNKRGRHKTAAYRSWEVLAGASVKDSHRAGYTVPCRLSIGAARPDKRRRDISNIIKVTEDFLVANGVVEDDHLFHDVQAQWSAEVETGIVVLVQPLENPCG